jgi:hypothetical protein
MSAPAQLNESPVAGDGYTPRPLSANAVELKSSTVVLARYASLIIAHNILLLFVDPSVLFTVRYIRVLARKQNRPS